jgi:hypothetical protein
MAALPLFVLAFCSAASVLASPRNLNARSQGRDAIPGGDLGHADYSHDESWGSKTNGWGSSSPYDGSWDHSSSAGLPGSQYGGGGGGWSHTSTCAASTIVETSTSTSTVYVSGSDYTSYFPASTVYITGPEHTSFIPASTVTVAGPAETSVSTTTQPAVSTTIFVTQIGLGWNRTITQDETSVTTTTQRDTSTIYNEETTTATSVVTLPGRPLDGMNLLEALLMPLTCRYHSDGL